MSNDAFGFSPLFLASRLARLSAEMRHSFGEGLVGQSNLLCDTFGIMGCNFLVQLVCRGAGGSLRFSPRELSSCTACLRVSRLFGRYWVLTSLNHDCNGTCYLCPSGRVTPHPVRHRRALPLGLCSKINLWIPKWTKW